MKLTISGTNLADDDLDIAKAVGQWLYCCLKDSLEWPQDEVTQTESYTGKLEMNGAQWELEIDKTTY